MCLKCVYQHACRVGVKTCESVFFLIKTELWAGICFESQSEENLHTPTHPVLRETFHLFPRYYSDCLFRKTLFSLAIGFVFFGQKGENNFVHNVLVGGFDGFTLSGGFDGFTFVGGFRWICACWRFSMDLRLLEVSQAQIHRVPVRGPLKKVLPHKWIFFKIPSTYFLKILSIVFLGQKGEGINFVH